ncbi:MAG: hypothetical protein ACK5AO_05760 [bacterium]|jgi:hypothetical protein
MKKIISGLVFVLMLIVTSSMAQDNSSSYSTAVGVKIYPGAISVKRSIDGQKYVEGLAAFWNKGFRATALLEFHNDFNNAPGLRWYYGAGAHLGFYNTKNYNGSTLFGIDGVLGLDYKIKGAPLNLSLDWQPSFEFGDGTGFEGWGGLGVRYTF